jgi:hypothetical protein
VCRGQDVATLVHTTSRAKMAMENSFFHRFTQRGVHVTSHKNWLHSKGLAQLSEWPGAGPTDCLYGAILKSASHQDLELKAPGVVSGCFGV